MTDTAELTQINQDIKKGAFAQIYREGPTSRPAGVIHRELPLNGCGIRKTGVNTYEIEGVIFHVVEAGSMICDRPQVINNACFYIAATAAMAREKGLITLAAISTQKGRTQIRENALELRKILVPRADELARKGGATSSFTFGEKETMAEIEVLYAYAEREGPMMVVFGDSNTVQLITHEKWLAEPDLQPIFLLNSNKHYCPLIRED